MLAHLPPPELSQYLDQVTLQPCTAKSLVDRQSLEAELALVRSQGYAINDEELEMGLRAVSAPIWDNSKRVVAAVNITGSTSSISQERLSGDLAEAVRHTAAQRITTSGTSSAISAAKPASPRGIAWARGRPITAHAGLGL